MNGDQHPKRHVAGAVAIKGDRVAGGPPHRLEQRRVFGQFEYHLFRVHRRGHRRHLRAGQVHLEKGGLSAGRSANRAKASRRAIASRVARSPNWVARLNSAVGGFPGGPGRAAKEDPVADDLTATEIGQWLQEHR